MIIGWPTVQKTSPDVITVPLDWTPFAPPAASSITAHSVAVDVASYGDPGFGNLIPLGTGGVTAVDGGVVGYLQTITLSGGNLWAYSIVSASVTFSDGTQLTRSFQVNIR